MESTAIEKVKENGKEVKTKVQQCMEEIDSILNKYECRPICIPQDFYGQRVFAWGLEEIKK